MSQIIRKHLMPRLGGCFALLCATGASAYEFNDSDRWSQTATDGSGLSQGDPTTLTWSIVRDGEGGGRSNPSSQLISFFDGLYPGGSGDDLTQRPWFFIFEDSFNRLDQLSGLSFVYEPNDDGVALVSGPPGPSVKNDGVLGVRGDIRINAYPIDGQSGSNTLARAFLPERGDITIDSDNTTAFGNDFNNSRVARNIFIHEVGHAVGLEHLESSDANFLMEPFLNVSFDGPQLDDVLALHRAYGDVNEKANAGAGNDTALNATPLGLLVDQFTARRGTHADDSLVFPTETDFLSIDDNSDSDYFSFSIDAPSTLDLLLTPKGPSYMSGPQGGTQSLLETASLSDLALALFDSDGTTQLEEADAMGAGLSEAILGFELQTPGEYFVRITGSANAPQLYQIDLTATMIVSEPVVGDLDGDGFVDENDLFIVLNNFATSVTPGSLPDGDPTGDGAVGIDDIDFILARWTGSEAPAAFTVPEPASGVGLLLLGALATQRRRA